MPPPIFKPELIGDRFADHQVPLEVLEDFAAFEELLMEVAKREYLEDHRDRLRIPKGFTKGVELRLAAIEEGSAILSLVVAGGLTLMDTSRYIERAQVKIVDAIANISDGNAPGLAPELLRYFDRFGRSLLDGECIRFGRADGRQTSLTPAVRERLLRASKAEEWTEERLLKGRVSAMDMADGEFELELADGSKLKAPLEEQHHDTVIEAMKEYGQGRTLAVKGVVRRNRNGYLKKFDSIEHVNLLHPLDVETRLEELGALRDGWLNGKGTAFDRERLKALAETFDKNFDAALPLPHLYPTPEGGILAEWGINDWAVSLDVELANQTAQYEALNLLSEEAVEFPVDLTVQAGWTALNEALRQLGADARPE